MIFLWEFSNSPLSHIWFRNSFFPKLYKLSSFKLFKLFQITYLILFPFTSFIHTWPLLTSNMNLNNLTSKKMIRLIEILKVCTHSLQGHNVFHYFRDS